MSERQVEADLGTPDAASAEETSIGLEENIAGALSYISIIGLVFFIIEDESDFVRFHAAQSIAYSAVLIVVFTFLFFIGIVAEMMMLGGTLGVSLIGLLFSLIIGFVWLILLLGNFITWIYLVIKAYQGTTPRLPVAASIADRLV